MAHSHAEVPSLQCPQCGASFSAEIGLSGDEDKLREAPAAVVPPAGPEVLGTFGQDMNPELTGRAGAELVTLEAAMAVAAVGADKKGGKRRLGPAVMSALLGASLLGACAPVGPQTVEPIVEQANTTGAGATIPTYAELVAKAMGGGFDPESLEPGRAAALEQLRQTFFVREYDTDGDQQLDGPILSELGENTVQWAVDGVTPYLAGEEINEVYGGGTETALLVSGFRPGEPLVLSVAGANAELEKQGVPANGKYLVVMSPTQAVVTDERSNPVAEVGADGVWRAMEVMATEVPTETPEPTAEPTATPMIELGATRVNSETQITEVYVGDGTYAPTPLESEFFDPAHLVIEGD